MHGFNSLELYPFVFPDMPVFKEVQHTIIFGREELIIRPLVTIPIEKAVICSFGH
jgi:hypothetical protein